jgi:hypothetical protein
MNHDEFYAYAVGYYEGRTTGIEREYHITECQMYYILGFDRGVADYCEFDVDSTGE